MEWLILIGIGIYIYSKLSNIADRTTTDVSDADLADFRITINTPSSGFGQQPSKNKEPGKWVQPGQSVKIAKYEIKGGYFYCGGQLKSTDNYGTEASLVDPTLKVNTKLPDYKGVHMGYWPRYCDITPQSRAAYIEWLASNRTDPDCYIGYVFLYFYGIERRLLIDGKHISASERMALVNELWRLKQIYSSSSSFNGYVTKLLSHVRVLYGIEGQPAKSLLTGQRQFTSVFKYLLGKAAASGVPVASELALAWVKSHPLYSLRTPARRCATEFDLLFKRRYKEKFGQGMVIKPNKTRLQIDYFPASSTLRGYRGITFDLPDPSLLKGPITKLIYLAGSCTDELDTYSRYIGNPANDRNSLTSIVYLPNALTDSIQHDKFDKLKSWIRSKMTNVIGVVPAEDLSSQVWEETPTKINKKEAEILATLVEKTGYGLAPDVRFHHAKPEISGCVVLFENGHDHGFSPSDEFNQIGTILRLGAMVATIDGRVDDAEVSILEMLISEKSELSGTEKKSLYAYLHWRLNTKSEMSGLKARLQQFSNREKSAISHILVTVAFADGKIEPEEIKQLRKLYTSLGLDETMVSGDIHHLTSNKIKPLPYVKQATTKISNVPAPEFSLNSELLNIYKEETEGVKSVLDSIFVEDIVDEDDMIADDHIVTGQMADLDEGHAQFFEKLISKEEWSSEEVKEMCEDLNLMADGAIEVINDWANENVSAPLIEIGNMIHIDLEVAQEIRVL